MLGAYTDGHLDIVKSLIQSGAFVNAKNGDGDSLLTLSANNNDIETVSHVKSRHMSI